ncbi:MAG: response regulator [Cyanobacteriota bacterium]
MKEKILIVDDEICWLSSHNEIINLAFPDIFEIQVASSAESALELINDFNAELLITDLQMEDIKGESFAGEFLIKNIKKKLPDIKIIIISGAPDLAKIAKRNKVDKHIPKWALNRYPLMLKMSISEIFKINSEIC